MRQAMNNKSDIQKLRQPNQRIFPFSIGDTNGVAKNARVLHWHKEMEICHVKSGSGKYLINGKEYEFTKGDVFIINNDEIHLCFDDRDLIMQVVMFDPSFIWSGSNNMFDYEYLKPFLETGSNFCNKLDGENDKIHLVITTLHEIENEYNDMNDGCELMIKSLLLRLMALIIRHFKLCDNQYSGELVSPRISQKIRLVIEYMEAYYFKPLKIAELACIAQMSVPYFCNTFKTLVGVPPMDFIIRKRVSAAKEALKNTDQNILNISGECGFNSISNFNHIFRECTGLSPSAYRKS
jgi:AraC-like DNA-binding protein